MPDGIVEIVIDIGTINEAKKRIAMRRLANDPNFASNFRNSLSKAMDNIVDMIRRMGWQEEDSDEA